MQKSHRHLFSTMLSLESVIAIVNEFFFFGISMLLDDAIILIKRVSENNSVDIVHKIRSE